MRKLALLFMLPLAACMTPDQLAQMKADRAAQAGLEVKAENACIDRGLSPHREAFVRCVNTQLRADGIKIARLDNGGIMLRPISDPVTAMSSPEPAQQNQVQFAPATIFARGL